MGRSGGGHAALMELVVLALPLALTFGFSVGLALPDRRGGAWIRANANEPSFDDH